MERSWSLYNKVERLRIDDLRADQVRTIMLAIPSSQINNWYACQDGDLHWMLLQTLPEFHVDYLQSETVLQQMQQPLGKVSGDNFSEPLMVPPVPQTKARRPLFEDAPEPLHTNPALEVSQSQTQERRSARRYHKKIQFSLSHEGKAFSSHTVDVSMGGMSIADQFPSWAPKTFKATLCLHQQNIVVFCKRISSNQMRIMDADSWELLRSWLLQR